MSSKRLVVSTMCVAVCCSVLLTRLVYTTHEHIWVPRTYMSPKRQASSFRLIVLQWFTVFGSRDSRTYASSWLSSWLILTWWHVWPTWMCRDRGVVHVWHTNIYEFVTEFVTTCDLIEVRCTCDSQECVATEAGMVHVWLTWICWISRHYKFVTEFVNTCDLVEVWCTCDWHESVENLEVVL